MIREIIQALATIAVVFLLFWVFSSATYFMFFEDMVMDTIREMVKPEALQ